MKTHRHQCQRKYSPRLTSDCGCGLAGGSGLDLFHSVNIIIIGQCQCLRLHVSGRKLCTASLVSASSYYETRFKISMFSTNIPHSTPSFSAPAAATRHLLQPMTQQARQLPVLSLVLSLVPATPCCRHSCRRKCRDSCTRCCPRRKLLPLLSIPIPTNRIHPRDSLIRNNSVPYGQTQSFQMPFLPRSQPVYCLDLAAE